MKKTLITALTSLALLSTAGMTHAEQLQCGVVINFPAGGTSDRYAKLLQQTNPEWKIEYQVGSFATKAISFLGDNTSYVYFGSPVMFGEKNPDQNPPVELYRILIGAPVLAVTGKNVTLEDFKNKPLNVGVPSFGTAHHMIALQLKEKNPNIEVISTGGDSKALPMISNGDLDVYFVSKPAGLRFLNDHSSFSQLAEFKFGEPVDVNGAVIKSQGFNGLFVHKNATEKQRQFIKNCVDKSLSDPLWAETLSKMGVDAIDVTGEKKDQALQEYVANLKKNGL